MVASEPLTPAVQFSSLAVSVHTFQVTAAGPPGGGGGGGGEGDIDITALLHFDLCTEYLLYLENCV